MATKFRVMGATIMMLGALLVLIPWYFFPVCVVGWIVPGMGLHGCHGTLLAVTALGAMAMAGGMVPLIWPNWKTVYLASGLGLVTAFLAVLFPLAITGLCHGPNMPCRIGTLPALEVWSLFMGIVSFAGFALARRR